MPMYEKMSLPNRKFIADETAPFAHSVSPLLLVLSSRVKELNYLPPLPIYGQSSDEFSF
jgi:hypothetical protein